ncbi:TPR-like protein [Hyphopichia burtonii NRRL Y-1933]|uniref:TPR-like protein n=2 Tax=Dikarya TaxID=451864 RepID=A0A1E4RQF1_9ASCO|nr:TPR-like protein [Hyphopichia burtonii NRRL Y-1933]ODV69500.1 TPR-like protein [Hyphopichia burtonii NRRL Y-1933]
MDELISEWDRRRYIPKPGEPDLPPQLSDMAEKSSEDIMKELNRLPFFMTELDETDGDGGENTNLEALKSLAYDGEPDEIATNFKNQGNDCFKAKQYKNAITYYTQGIEVEHNVTTLKVALLVNRAACNLELKNFRRCIEDCKQVLLLDDKNVKACYRSGKAFLAVSRFEEAKAILEYGLAIDPENKPMKDTLDQTIKKQKQINDAIERKERETKEAEMKKTILVNAVKLRHMRVLKASRPAELLEEAEIRLEDPLDHESQLIFPAMILYPTIDEFDFVAEISELSTPQEILELIMNRPKEWFENPKHKSFALVKKLQCFMETEAGGLVKIGKNAPINNALMSDKAKAPLFDNALRLYVVPKDDVEGWLKTWNKEAALKKRNL